MTTKATAAEIEKKQRRNKKTKKKKASAKRPTSERMRAWESRGSGPPRGSRAGPLRGVGQRPTSEAKPSEQDAPSQTKRKGEYQSTTHQKQDEPSQTKRKGEHQSTTHQKQDAPRQTKRKGEYQQGEYQQRLPQK